MHPFSFNSTKKLAKAEIKSKKEYYVQVLIPKKNNPRYVVLDLSRGIAAIGVMSYHFFFLKIDILSGFNIFVDFFFVLSGFVLAPSLLSTNFNNKYFIKKRLLRFWPSLIPVFLFTILKDFSKQHVEVIRVQSNTDSLKMPLIYVGSFLLLQIFSVILISVNVPLWSLSAEFFVNIFASIISNIKNIAKVGIFVGASLIFMGFYLNNRFNLGWENFHYTFGLGRGCVGFFIGILLRKSESEKEIKFSKRRFIFAIVGFLATFSIYPFVQAVIFIAAIPSYFVISEASRVNVNGLNRKFHSSCVFLGKISFGLYIWHAPLIGSHRPVQSILGIEPNSVAGSISSVIVQIGLTVFLTILSVTYFDKFFRSLLQKLFETR